MRAVSLAVILHTPDMPQNTGNVIRLCANAGASLHLVRPLGFAWDDARLRRAHLDYREYADVRLHNGWPSAKAALDDRRIFAIETGGVGTIYDASFQPGDALLFGSESRGLPDEILNEIPPERRLALPMMPESRSLNLGNAVAVAVYEAWRQLGFPGAAPVETVPREASFEFFNGRPDQSLPQ